MKGSQAVIVHAAHDLRWKERNTHPLNYYNALNAMCMMEQYLVERNKKNHRDGAISRAVKFSYFLTLYIFI